MANIAKFFKTDTLKETDGVWYPVIDNAEIKVARKGNSKYTAALQKHFERWRPMARNRNVVEVIPPDELSAIVRKVYAETILLDWRNVEDDDGNTIPYSVDKACELLQMDDFFTLVEQIADDMAVFKASADEDAIKN